MTVILRVYVVNVVEEDSPVGDVVCVSVFVCHVFVLVAYEVVFSVCVILVLLVDVEEEPAEVPGMCVARMGDEVLWVLVSMDAIVGTVVEVVMTLDGMPVFCTVGIDGMIYVGVAKMLEAVSVEVRSVMVVSEPVVPLDVGIMVVSLEVGMPLLTEDEFMVVVILGVPVVEGVEVIADVVVHPVGYMFEEVTPGVLCGVVGVGVVTIVVVVSGVEKVGKEAVFKVAMVEMLVGVVIAVVAVGPVLVEGIGVDVTWAVGSIVIKVDKWVVFVVQLETDFVDGAGREDRCILVADVKVFMVTGIEETDVVELTVFLSVINDVIVGEVIFVMRDTVEASFVGISVTFQVGMA